MTPLRSAQNPLVKRLKALGDKKGREREGLMLVEGEVMILEALGAGLTPVCAFVEEDGPFEGLAVRLEAAGASVYSVPRSLIESVCGTKTPQGACAAVPLPTAQSLPRTDRLVALDGVQDPGNVGTIWRTADAAGFGGLLLSAACADPFSPKVQRAAMGSGFRLPVFTAPSLPDELIALREAGCHIVVSALDGEPFYSADLPKERVVLVVGNEARGVSPEVQALGDVRLKLPMRGGAESLNAAVAAGIMMYELTRHLP